MKKQTITLEGKTYPCRMTMGAMVEFKNATGREVTEIKQDGLEDVLTLLYCSILSASRVDGVSLPFSSMMDMADRMEPGDMTDWSTSNLSSIDRSVDLTKKKNA